jgi:imidazoleglycerol-phosphate dehydratase / histidinol-phosphatase
MKKVLFIDRDGTLILEPPTTFQVDSLTLLEYYPRVFQYLSRIVTELDYDLVMVSNQDGLGTPLFPEETFWPVQNTMLKAFKNEGITFNDILIDRSLPEEQLPTRKPGIGMLTKYLIPGLYNIAESFVIGDRLTDVQLANNIGCQSIYLGNEICEATLKTQDWSDIYRYLKKQPRIATTIRKTSETNIEVSINLDGTGKSEIQTGLGFFDHMLQQIAKHGGIDLFIKAEGDLLVDEHHTIEDVALVLGETFFKALGTKKGIQRYGFLLPMDDTLAEVAIDFGGRPWLVWETTFTREKIGEMPTEMFMHFFKSFSDTAKCNLNIKASGINEHHKIEAIFKAFAKAIQMAVGKTADYTIPSTKGSL